MPTKAREFWSLVQFDDSGCWLWQGGKDSLGYGHVGSRKGITPSGTKMSHRVAWELTRGDIPAGLHLDHICRRPACVNPDHLEPVTVKENVRRGLHGVLRTHCPQGHELTPDNTRVRPGDSSRQCRECRREEKRNWAARRRATQREQDRMHASDRSVA